MLFKRAWGGAEVSTAGSRERFLPFLDGGRNDCLWFRWGSVLARRGTDGFVPAGIAASMGAYGTGALSLPPGVSCAGGMVSASRLHAVQATTGSVSMMGCVRVEESNSGKGDAKVSSAPVRAPPSNKAAA